MGSGAFYEHDRDLSPLIRVVYVIDLLRTTSHGFQKNCVTQQKKNCFYTPGRLERKKKRSFTICSFQQKNKDEIRIRTTPQTGLVLTQLDITKVYNMN